MRCFKVNNNVNKIFSQKLPDDEALEGGDKIRLVDDTTPEFDDLTEVDQIYQVFKKVKCCSLRINAMKFAHTFRAPCEKLLEMGEKMKSFVRTIKNNQNFERWLEYILAFGNYMNGTGFYGGAYGFKMDTIRKISEVKTTDDSRNLLEFIIEEIGRKEKDRELLDFYLELKDIENGN
jgi:hypothetical protein